MTRPTLHINLIEEPRFGQMWKTVTFTVESEDEAFCKLPYLAYRSNEVEFNKVVRESFEAGMRHQQSERGGEQE